MVDRRSRKGTHIGGTPLPPPPLPYTHPHIICLFTSSLTTSTKPHSVPVVHWSMTTQINRHVTISEYAARHGISESTVRRRIKTGLLDADMESGRYVICDDTVPNQDEQVDEAVASHDEQTEPSDPLVDQMQSEIAHLRDQLTNRDKQIDQLSHLLAMTTAQNGELTQQLPPPRQPIIATLKRGLKGISCRIH